MNRIVIKSGAGLTGIVYPDYGGMLGQLTYDGREIFFLEEDRLTQSAVLAGGNPVLYPVAGKTFGDRYNLNDKTYRMPFHGLVKDSAFGVESVTSDSVTLYRTSSKEWTQDLYPFEFTLKLRYQVVDSRLTMRATVVNHSEESMPHAFGWHPYFVASGKARFTVDANMSRCALYTPSGPEEIALDAADFTRPSDYVYWGRTGAMLTIKNPADGYAVNMISDQAFEALVVCAKFDRTLCVEPWMSLPGALNTRGMLKWVQPGAQMRYEVRMDISKMEGTP